MRRPAGRTQPPERYRHNDLLRVTGFIDPAAQAWLSSLSKVPAVLQSRPR